MAQAQRYKLKLSKLQFCSLVDKPAQPNAKTLLIKRASKGDEITATARLAKVNDELGLAFFWAFTSTNKDGSEHYDLQGDQVTEFIKAAMDYMTESQGAVDVMHDGVAGEDRVVFAMPMDPDIAEAYGMVTKQTGLMVAVKPTAENLAKLKSGELNGVSIGGLGERVPVGKAKPSFAVGDHVECLVNHMPGMKGMTGDIAIAREGTPPYYGVKFDDQKAMPGVHKWLAQDEIKAAPADAKTSMPEMKRAPAGVRKEAVLTSTVDGHAHTISLDDPARYWSDQLQTSYQTMDGADGVHSHAWVFDGKAGTITIADDSGHGHMIAAAVPSDVLAVYAVREAQRDAQNLAEAAAPQQVDDDPSDGIPTAATDEESSGKVINVVIAARAPANKSTRSTPVREGDNTMKLVILSDAQHAHYSKLSATEQEAFVNKSTAERDGDIAKALDADPIVFKGERSGLEVRKSQGEFAMKLAKQAEENAATMAKQAEEIAKRDEAIEKSEIRKQASELLAGMPGDDDTHDMIVRALRKSADPVKALEALKGIVATSSIGKRAPGFSGGGEPVAVNKQQAYAALSKALVEFCTEQKIAKVWTDGLDAFVQTPVGKALSSAYEAAQAAA